MAEAPEVKAVVEEFLTRQREMYAGGDLEAIEELLAEDIVWHVPGTSSIAGDYRGREAVIGYFRLRRELAGGAIGVAKGGEAQTGVSFELLKQTCRQLDEHPHALTDGAMVLVNGSVTIADAQGAASAIQRDSLKLVYNKHVAREIGSALRAGSVAGPTPAMLGACAEARPTL